MNAEGIYKGFTRFLAEDVFPPIWMAGYFGMGGEDKDLGCVQPVLGVWQGLNKHGLLEKDAFKLAIRQNKIGEFFERGRVKLAAAGYGYALKVQEMNVVFDAHPPLGLEPPQDIVIDTEDAYIYAIDTYAMPRFQTPATQRAAWDKAERLLGQLMSKPLLVGAVKVLKCALGLYEEAREIYNMKRKIPAGLAAIVREMKANGHAAAQDSSDSDSEEDW